MPRHHKTLMDYLVITITPALIMTLIGSLTFFLITVFYEGAFEMRLHFICAMYVMATVLIGRISMEEGTEPAVMYSIPLGLVAILAVTNLVEIQSESLREISGIINVGLLAIIWWSAHKLTWDCTWINEDENAGGEGLLGNLGLDDPRYVGAPAGNVDHPVHQQAATEPSLSWWQRFTQRRRRPHAPGLWVIYFSLAALPLFGFGQWFLRDQDPAVQQYAFLLLCVYVVSGLCLLLTTSFLGLRRYLRQRKVEMPIEMAATWLGIGVSLIVLMLLFCLLLPRPGHPSVFTQLAKAWQSSDDLESSKKGVGKDGIDGENPGPGESPGQDGPGNGKQTGDSSNDSSGSSDQSGKPGSGSSSDSQDEAGSSSGSQSGGQSSGNNSGQANDPNSKQGGDQGSQSDDSAESGSQSSGDESESGAEGNKGDSQDASSNPWLPKHLPESLPAILKILFYVILCLIGIYLLVRYWKQFVAAWKKFLAELRSFWNWLRGLRERPETESAEAGTQVAPPVHRSFASFSNPFNRSKSRKWTVEQMVLYSFEALEAWARESGYGRQEYETPSEFTRSLGKRSKEMAPSLRRLGKLYSRAAYAPGKLPDSCLADVRSFWQLLPAPRSHTLAAPATSTAS